MSRKKSKEDYGQLIFAMYRVARKMRGMGHLITQERMDDMAIDSENVRLGIGLVLMDMAEELFMLLSKIEFWQFEPQKDPNP